MGKRLRQALAALLCLTGCSPQPTPQSKWSNGEIKHWAVYYSDILPAKDFKHMDMVVFDRRHYPEFKEIQPHTLVLAYVSIGEVYDDVPEQKLLKNKNLILYQQDKWKSHVIDVTSDYWRKMVIDYVDDAAAKGFDGVMLDTIDTPLYWAETQAPSRLEAMREGAALLIHTIRMAHPHMKIMLNRGFSILPLVTDDINYVLAESIMTKTDVSTGQFELFPPNTYSEVAEQLHRAMTIAPRRQVLTLDYWNSDDVNGLERIYRVQRGNGFVPYVTTPDLTDFTPEPPHTRPHHTP